MEMDDFLDSVRKFKLVSSSSSIPICKTSLFSDYLYYRFYSLDTTLHDMTLMLGTDVCWLIMLVPKFWSQTLSIIIYEHEIFSVTFI